MRPRRGLRVVDGATPPTDRTGELVRRGLAWGIVNSITMRMATLAIGIVLARLLTPDSFGAFAVALVIQTILINFADLGMSADLIRNREWQRRVPTVSSISLLAGGLLSAAMIVAAPVLASSLGSKQASPVIAVMSLSLVIAGAGVAPFAAMQRNFQQSRYFLVVVTSFLLGSAVTVLLIVAFGWGAMALAVGKLVEQTCSVTLQFVLTRTRPHFGFDRSVARSALAFGLPVCGANALSWLVLNVDYIVIGRTAGALVLGLYVLAFNMASWPVNALVSAIRNVALPGFSRLDRAASARSFVSSFALVLTVGLLVSALLAPLARPVVASVYGAKWLGSAGVLGVLALFGTLRMVFDLTATFLIARGASRSVLFIQLAWVAALVPAMIIGVHAGGIVGAGVAHVVVACSVVLPAYLVALSRHSVTLPALMRAAAPPAAAALVAGEAVWASSRVTDVAWRALLVGATVGLVVYVPLLYRWLRARVAAAWRPPEPEQVPAAVG